MLLRKLVPRNFGPFFGSDAAISIEDQVTVLTGANDTGKSGLLRLLKLICSIGQANSVAERDLNSEFLEKSGQPWDQAQDVGAAAVFAVTPVAQSHFKSAVQPGDEFTVQFRLTPQAGHLRIAEVTGKGKSFNPAEIRRMPKVLSLPFPDSTQVREQINLTQPNEAELALLQLGFGTSFNFPQLKGFNNASFLRTVTKAESRLNEHLGVVLPSLDLKFKLNTSVDKREDLYLDLIDRDQTHTGLGSRGTGIQRLVGLVGALATAKPIEGHLLILLDEPETSLHADAQHGLRNVLEGLAADPAIQVIYATHSPSMLNTTRPESVRLLTRNVVRGQPTTLVNNSPIGGNYLSVRTSLGLSAADSLLYAPVTVVVEGRTEVICIQLLLDRFHKEQVPGFEDLPKLLANVCFLDGAGDNYPTICHLARAQGTRPIVFLDGDKIRNVQRQGLAKKCPEVPILHLPEGEEFEDLVPREVYFTALAEHYRQPPDHPELPNGITLEEFTTWKEQAKPHPKMLFSKQVDLWLTPRRDLPAIVKPAVMRLAIEATPLDQLETIKMRELLKAIDDQAKNCTTHNVRVQQID